MVFEPLLAAPLISTVSSSSAKLFVEYSILTVGTEPRFCQRISFKSDDFQTAANDIAMHIAASQPQWVRREDVPPDAIENERNIYRAQMEGAGKPANVLDKIIEGKLTGFYSQFVLLDQPSIRDPNLKIGRAHV